MRSKQAVFAFCFLSLAVVSLGFTSGCCDCAGAFNDFRVGSHVAIAELSITGVGCEPPTCQGGDMMSGGCSQFVVKLTGVGTCNLVATAVDGRQVSLDVPVRHAGDNCCGAQFRVDTDTSDLFGVPDGGAD